MSLEACVVARAPRGIIGSMVHGHWIDVCLVLSLLVTYVAGPKCWANESHSTTGQDWSLVKVAETPLPTRLRKALIGDGLVTIEDVLAKSEAEILRLRNVNYVSVNELTEYLNRLGLSLLGGVKPAPPLLDHVDAKDRTAPGSVDWPSFPVAAAGLSRRTTNCLANARLVTIGDVLRRTEDEVLRLENMGRRSLNEIKEFLDRRGLAFRSTSVESDQASIRGLDMNSKLKNTLLYWGLKTLEEVTLMAEDELIPLLNGVDNVHVLRSHLKAAGFPNLNQSPFPELSFQERVDLHRLGIRTHARYFESESEIEKVMSLDSAARHRAKWKLRMAVEGAETPRLRSTRLADQIASALAELNGIVERNGLEVLEPSAKVYAHFRRGHADAKILGKCLLALETALSED